MVDKKESINKKAKALDSSVPVDDKGVKEKVYEKKPRRQNKSKKRAEQDKSPKVKKPLNKNLLIGIIGGALALALIFLVVFVFRKTPDYNNPKASPTYTNAFFLYNDGKYTLWNSEGKRLTEDEYNDKSAFIGGYAYVRKGREYALISDTGRIMMDFGQISDIINYGAGLYLVEDNDSARYLMLGNGKILLGGDDIELDFPSNTSTFAAVRAEDNYYIFNYAGTMMAQIEFVEDGKIRFNTGDDFGLVFYNGINYLFDNRAGKLIATFEADRFSVNKVSDDRSVILLQDEDGKNYKVVKKGHLYDLNETENYALLRDSNWVIGFDDTSAISLLDDEFKVIKKVNSDIAIKDSSNYAVVNGDGNIDIVYRNNVVKTFEHADLVSGVLSHVDLYAIRYNGKYVFYKLDGSLAFGEYNDVRSLYDKHRHVSVSDDGENYYMIDANGNRLNDLTYQRTYAYDHSYVVYNADSKRAILTENGMPVTGFDYTDAYKRSSAVDHEIWSLKREANKYDIVDVTAPADKRVLLQNANVYDFYANYFTTKNDDGGYDFYTYKGVQFYRTTKK